MPNNLQILAYIQCLKDRLERTVVHMQLDHSPSTNSYMNFLEDIENLEKFIKGGI